jgi:hypothetical protein
MSVSDPALVARDLQQRWSHDFGVAASLTTVKRRLKKFGIVGHIAKKSHYSRHVIVLLDFSGLVNVATGVSLSGHIASFLTRHLCT